MRDGHSRIHRQSREKRMAKLDGFHKLLTKRLSIATLKEAIYRSDMF